MNRESEDVIRSLGVIAENLESRLAPGSAGVLRQARQLLLASDDRRADDPCPDAAAPSSNLGPAAGGGGASAAGRPGRVSFAEPRAMTSLRRTRN